MNYPWLEPINILEKGYEEKIKRAGEIARSMIVFDLICLEHGLFAQEVVEHNIQREETRHRNMQECWHEIKISQSKK
jgi:hypothetical protein